MFSRTLLQCEFGITKAHGAHEMFEIFTKIVTFGGTLTVCR